MFEPEIGDRVTSSWGDASAGDGTIVDVKDVENVGKLVRVYWRRSPWGQTKSGYVATYSPDQLTKVEI